MNKSKTTMDYFTHSTTLFNSPDIEKLRVRTRQDICKAYTLYMLLLEDLAYYIDQESLELDKNSIEVLSFKTYMEVEEIKKYLNLFQELDILNIENKLCDTYIISDNKINSTKTQVKNKREFDKNKKQEERTKDKDNVELDKDNVILKLNKTKENKTKLNNLVEEDNNNIVVIITEEDGTTTPTTTTDLIEMVSDLGIKLNERQINEVVKLINEDTQCVYDSIVKIENSSNSLKNTLNFNYFKKTYEDTIKLKNTPNLKNLSTNKTNSDSVVDTMSEEEQAKELQRLKEERRLKTAKAEEAKQQFLKRKNEKSKTKENENEIESDIAIC